MTDRYTLREIVSRSLAGGRMLKLLTQAYVRWRIIRSLRRLSRVCGDRFDVSVVRINARADQIQKTWIAFWMQGILGGLTHAAPDTKAGNASAQTLSQAYRRLPKAQRRMLLLYEFRGLDHRLIAQRLGISKVDALQQLRASLVQFEHEVRLLESHQK